jgi:hypothetical protein
MLPRKADAVKIPGISGSFVLDYSNRARVLNVVHRITHKMAYGEG